MLGGSSALFFIHFLGHTDASIDQGIIDYWLVVFYSETVLREVKPTYEVSDIIGPVPLLCSQ